MIVHAAARIVRAMRADDVLASTLGWPPGRVVVISPHLDDAVLSLGATIARASRRGARVCILTVLAGDPESQLPAGGWDREAGFVTQGEAAVGRREEDRRACGILGADPVWLPFPDSQYVHPRHEGDVVSAVHGVVQGADGVLLPGHPLSNRDHAWLTTTLLGSGLPAGQVGFYAEQPYAGRLGVQRSVPGAIEGLRVAWRPAQTRLLHRVTKVRAISSYRSQLPLLGLSQRRHAGLVRMLRAAHPAGLEELGWIEGDAGRAAQL